MWEISRKLIKTRRLLIFTLKGVELLKMAHSNRVFSNFQQKGNWSKSYSVHHKNLTDISQPLDFSYPRGLYADRVSKYIERNRSSGISAFIKKDTLEKMGQKQRYPMVVGWSKCSRGELFLKIKEFPQSDIVYYRKRF